MFCRNCGNIVRGEKCHKCGGKPVESIITSTAFAADKRDPWLTGYMEKKLVNDQQKMSRDVSPKEIKTRSISFTNDRNGGTGRSFKTQSTSFSFSSKNDDGGVLGKLQMSLKSPTPRKFSTSISDLTVKEKSSVPFPQIITPNEYTETSGSNRIGMLNSSGSTKKGSFHSIALSESEAKGRSMSSLTHDVFGMMPQSPIGIEHPRSASRLSQRSFSDTDPDSRPSSPVNSINLFRLKQSMNASGNDLTQIGGSRPPSRREGRTESFSEMMERIKGGHDPLVSSGGLRSRVGTTESKSRETVTPTGLSLRQNKASGVVGSTSVNSNKLKEIRKNLVEDFKQRIGMVPDETEKKNVPTQYEGVSREKKDIRMSLFQNNKSENTDRFNMKDTRDVEVVPRGNTLRVVSDFLETKSHEGVMGDVKRNDYVRTAVTSANIRPRNTEEKGVVGVATTAKAISTPEVLGGVAPGAPQVAEIANNQHHTKTGISSTGLASSVEHKSPMVKSHLRNSLLLQLEAMSQLKPCSVCQKKLKFQEQKEFASRPGVSFCSDCYNKEFTKGVCLGCNRIVLTHGRPWVGILSNVWHKLCMKCSVCGMLLSGSLYTVVGSKLFCDEHSNGGAATLMSTGLETKNVLHDNAIMNRDNGKERKPFEFTFKKSTDTPTLQSTESNITGTLEVTQPSLRNVLDISDKTVKGDVNKNTEPAELENRQIPACNDTQEGDNSSSELLERDQIQLQQTEPQIEPLDGNDVNDPIPEIVVEDDNNYETDDVTQYGSHSSTPTDEIKAIAQEVLDDSLKKELIDGADSGLGSDQPETELKKSSKTRLSMEFLERSHDNGILDSKSSLNRHESQFLSNNDILVYKTEAVVPNISSATLAGNAANGSLSKKIELLKEDTEVVNSLKHGLRAQLGSKGTNKSASRPNSILDLVNNIDLNSSISGGGSFFRSRNNINNGVDGLEFGDSFQKKADMFGENLVGSPNKPDSVGDFSSYNRFKNGSRSFYDLRLARDQKTRSEFNASIASFDTRGLGEVFGSKGRADDGQKSLSEMLAEIKQPLSNSKSSVEDGEQISVLSIKSKDNDEKLSNSSGTINASSTIFSPCPDSIALKDIAEDTNKASENALNSNTKPGLMQYDPHENELGLPKMLKSRPSPRKTKNLVSGANPSSKYARPPAHPQMHTAPTTSNRITNNVVSTQSQSSSVDGEGSQKRILAGEKIKNKNDSVKINKYSRGSVRSIASNLESGVKDWNDEAKYNSLDKSLSKRFLLKKKSEKTQATTTNKYSARSTNNDNLPKSHLSSSKPTAGKNGTSEFDKKYSRDTIVKTKNTKVNNESNKKKVESTKPKKTVAHREGYCSKCDNLIVDTWFDLFDGAQLHPSCFTCLGCNKLIDDGVYMVENDSDYYHPSCVPYNPPVVTVENHVSSNNIVSGTSSISSSISSTKSSQARSKRGSLLKKVTSILKRGSVGGESGKALSRRSEENGSEYFESSRSRLAPGNASDQEPLVDGYEVIGEDDVLLCDGCEKAIDGPRFNLSTGKNYHPECFYCAGCEEKFDEGSYVCFEGLEYHQHCVPLIIMADSAVGSKSSLKASNNSLSKSNTNNSLAGSNNRIKNNSNPSFEASVREKDASYNKKTATSVFSSSMSSFYNSISGTRNSKAENSLAERLDSDGFDSTTSSFISRFNKEKETRNAKSKPTQKSKNSGETPTSSKQKNIYCCHRCQAVIVGVFVNLDNLRFHPKCFTCVDCNKVITPKMPFGDLGEGNPCCESCISIRYPE
ncbi:Four and a half LIM domains protein 5 [Zancudomyces culisetae]|uniref:Four and a half LIM domains protein 5 n=1 Tax=Zancudomyces culisetae TaxID=1213189 RepID=A0A1R1PSL3_ZANCU|nr:Four and a half LIM domains protein 5 [Zancudomyces culisetae]|eukprot:OMH83960.1 Four and a half LIM domains protein 5 [Zancudomyces culisetae]